MDWAPLPKLTVKISSLDREIADLDTEISTLEKELEVLTTDVATRGFGGGEVMETSK